MQHIKKGRAHLPLLISAAIVLLLIGLFAFFYVEYVHEAKEEDPIVISGSEETEVVFITDENVPTLAEKFDRIRLISPIPNTLIQSPLTIKGEALGTWFFEANAPIVLIDHEYNILGEGFTTAQGAWMTAEFVPFEGVFEFDTDMAESDEAVLILGKANPSGAMVYEDALEIPVKIRE